jgi:putative FmdB family regulatory protein
MPIFEYKCASCGNRFEKLIRRESDESGLTCPACGAEAPEKELSTFAAHATTRAAAPALPPCGAACPTPGLCSRN